MSRSKLEQQNISSIAKAGLCTGCGMCQAVCPAHAVQINLLKGAWFQAGIDKKLCTNCGLCLKVCGRNPEYQDTKYEESQEQNKYTPFLGCFRKCYLGHSEDIGIRWNGTSGGLITSILAFALRTGLIDSAIVVSPDAENLLIPQATVATSEEEVLQAYGSRYAPVPVNAAIKKALTLGTKIAVVGLPCHIQSLRRAQLQLPELSEKIVLSLGMFCSHNISLKATDFLLLHKGLKARDVLEFSYRGRGWPSGIRIRTKQGTTAYIPNNSSFWVSLFASFMYATPYCFSCTDQTNELADISFGDAWLPDVIKRDRLGRSICIARTKFGSSVLEQAVRAGVIQLADIEPERVVESQRWPLYFKKINVLCRKKLYPENAINVDFVLRNFPLTLADRLIDRFARFSSAVSNYTAKNKYLSYLTTKLLLLFAKPYEKILHRRVPCMSQVPPPPPFVADGDSEKGTNIAIVNQHGSNRGDESALRGMLYGLKKLIPDARFAVLTITPQEDFKNITEAKFHDTVFLLKNGKIKLIYFTLAMLLYRFGFRRISRLFKRRTVFTEILKDADLVISAPGGPYIGDLYRYCESSCAFSIYLAVLLGKPVMIYGPSQGPFDNEKRNRWRRRLLSKVEAISVRERFSSVYLHNLGIPDSRVHVTADSCLQKPVDDSLGRQILKQENLDAGKMLIGMVPLKEIPTEKVGEGFDTIALTVSVLRLLSEAFDADFLLIPQLYLTQNDFLTLVDIAEQSALDGKVHVLPDTYNSDQQQSLIGRLDLLVSFRYHPYIFAVRQGVPSVCVAYEHKAFGFAEAMNLQEYCLDLFSVTPAEIVKKARQVWKNREKFRADALANILRLEKLSMKNSELAAELLASHREKHRHAT